MNSGCIESLWTLSALVDCTIAHQRKADPKKGVAYAIFCDTKEAFDSVCQETKQTRTHQLINLMRDYVDLETRRLDQQNQSIGHQISRSRNRYQDKTGSNHQLSEDDWILVGNDHEFDSNHPLDFYPWKGF